MKIGERIHTNGWGTYVLSGAVCASSCAIIWLAGVPRTIEGAPGVIIGFHAVYDIETQKESGAANAILGAAMIATLTRWEDGRDTQDPEFQQALTDQLVRSVTRA